MEAATVVSTAQPAAVVATPSAELGPPQPQVPGPGPAGLTLRDVLDDKLTSLANAHWRLSEGQQRKAFEESLVQQLYATELGGGHHAPKAQRLSLLEISQARNSKVFGRMCSAVAYIVAIAQYMEAYLWPHFTQSSSREHLLSIMMLVNEKIREGLETWRCFADTEKFGVFFRR